ncbi:hypothetical protein D7294_27170 [Streptomyces hoynatensis]|uniref:Secreted protein n=1 Tax=Streptomyces hoynatensis TaxID=1141874 RepID=A0A3A9YND2_9ACTN|nr:hypothetical protein D7294_27170 [Streptomyces hoynatensis]
MRAALRTEPGRLRLIGAAIALLLLLFGGVTVWQVSDRTAAAATVIDSSQPLSTGAAEIYRALVDANTAAATGFLAGANEDPDVRQRYEDDIDNAARRLAAAAADSSGSDEAQEYITFLNQRLPVYTGLVEIARANNRQGLPLGGAYLRYANEQMQESLLRTADELYQLETRRFEQDMGEAKRWPWVATGVGLGTLLVLAWAQRRHYLRTNRVFDPGLLAATSAALVLLLWLTGAHVLARSALNDASTGAARSLSALNGAWTEALKARGDENLNLVARGASTEFEDSYTEHMNTLLGPDPEQVAGLLGEAEELADDADGLAPVRAAVAATQEWRTRHQAGREQELAGAYDEAVARAIGGPHSPGATTGQSFAQVNASLGEAVRHEQEQFTAAADRGRGRLGGLRVGAVALALLAVLGTALGVGRRLAEYR